MTTHEWRGSAGENGRTYYRANHHAGRWSFQMREADEDAWTTYEPETFPLEALIEFREVLWKKVQRRRVPEKHIDAIDALLQSRRPTED